LSRSSSGSSSRTRSSRSGSSRSYSYTTGWVLNICIFKTSMKKQLRQSTIHKW
jgi:hypothetical protein